MDPRQPAPIPDHEWQREATVAALRSRDAQALLRVARKYGVSQRYLSVRVTLVTGETLTQNQLSLIANGKSQVKKLEVWERLAAALDMPDPARMQLGLAPLSTAVTPADSNDLDSLEHMRRDLAGTFLSATTESTIADWEQLAWFYGRATRNTPPARLLEGVTVDFADLSVLLRQRQPARLQRRLCYVAAQFAGLVSLLLTNLGRYPDARRWGHTARLAVDEAADPALASWVRAQDAYALYYESADYPGAAEVAEHAQQLARNLSCPGVALSAALQARANAVTGRGHETHAALDRAERALAGLSAEASQPGAFGYNEAQLRFHEGNALTHLGETERAWIAQRRALELYPATDTLDRTLVHLDRAAALALAGDTEAAATYATSKLLELLPHQRTDLIIHRAKQLAVILQQDLRLPAVRDLRALVAEVSQPTPPAREQT
jgi:tetratricopeptide (TPR) repeat protein